MRRIQAIKKPLRVQRLFAFEKIPFPLIPSRSSNPMKKSAEVQSGVSAIEPCGGFVHLSIQT
jgi:hypothetical protein